MLYEISLKYNTLKMYENTLDQMKKNGSENTPSYTEILKEKSILEEELFELLNPKTLNEENTSENKFLNEVNKKAKYTARYNVLKTDNFFDNITKNDLVWYEMDTPDEDERKNEGEKEVKKPKFADIQDKISNSQWISCSNFIVEFPKDKIDIDEWRVSGFFYRAKPRTCCSQEKCTVNGGELIVTVNDFAEKREDGTYNILANIVNDLSIKSKAYVIGDIYARIINNNGEELYLMRFKNCRFISSDADGFNYETTSLRKVILQFEYDEMIILEPDEAAN